MRTETITPETRLAVGCTAEIYAWRDGQVLKLFYDWMPPEVVAYEAGLARAAHAALPNKIEAWAKQRFVALYLKHYFALRPGGQEHLADWEPLVAAARLSEGIVEEEARLLALARRL